MGLSLTTSIFALVMSNLHRPVSKKNTNTQLMGKQYFNALTRSIIVLGLVAGSNSLGLSPLLAAPTAPNTTIDNQATGTFTDGDDPGAQPESIVSNVVTVTVAEVAGISITADNTPEPYPNALVNFDFEIKNIGNDPTKFFLSTAPSSVVGGTAGTLQIVAYVDANGVKTTLTTPIDITTAGNTGSIGDGTLGSNITDGSIPAGAAIIVRVPVTVTAAVNTNVSVTLGNTTSSPNASNTSYIANTNDVYTVDNADTVVGETAGAPINGDVTQHRQEASAISTVLVQNPPLKISGTVFEDVNYGGGAGRDLVSSTGVVRPNVRVEIYNASGTIRGQMLTDTNGQYTFDASNVTGGLIQGNTYQIRVVNSFVTSSRPGGCPLAATVDLPPDSCLQVPVQTFRTSGDTDSNNIADADQNRVGGEVPSKKDAPANSSTQTLSALNSVAGQAVESLTTVVLGSAPFTGVDFGFNFDTIVNTKDSGQGSLRQFITNTNALGGEATLAQAGTRKNKSNVNEALPAGVETSIFMIPSNTDPMGRTQDVNFDAVRGVAKIIPLSLLPIITGTNGNFTNIDGTTQTVNIGDTNTGVLGRGGTVGVDKLILDKVQRPEVEIFGNNPSMNGLQAANVKDTSIRGLSVYGFYISINANNTVRTTVEQNIVGSRADAWVDPGTIRDGARNIQFISGNSGGIVRNNLVGFTAQSDAVTFESNNTGNLIENNDCQAGAVRSGSVGDCYTLYNGNSNNTIRGNFATDISANGVDVLRSSNGNFIENNTIINAGTGNLENAGIRITYYPNSDTASNNNTIRRNIITGSKTSGILIVGGTGNLITQNSTYNNSGIGIDILKVTETGNIAQSAGIAPYVTPNDGLNASDANKGMDYPIIQSASVSSNTLTIKGYVGTPTTSSDFAGATIEFFVGAADTNDKGKVFASDSTTTSRLHAEGQTYLGNCIADSNGKFNCPITVPTGTDPKTITSTATDAAGNTSEFSAGVSNPNVLLVKRITAINGITNTTGGDNLAGYIQEESNPYDDNVIETALAPSNNFPTPDTTYWPDTTGKASSDFLLGGINGGNIKPKDTIEYTIYFLSTGDSPAENVMFCDRVPSNTTFFPTAFNNSINSPAPGGTNDSRGILALINGTPASYTNVGDGDNARYVPAGTVPKDANNNIINCGGANDNGAVVFNLGTIPNATAQNTPGSYGFVRFQGRVK